MSGIYIPNMVNPVRCSECDFCTYGYCGLLDRYVTDSAYKDDACLLVPVPPHGDLIDRDALPWENQGLMLTDPDEWGLKAWDIEHAPTIIPADEPFGKSEQLNL